MKAKTKQIMEFGWSTGEATQKKNKQRKNTQKKLLWIKYNHSEKTNRGNRGAQKKQTEEEPSEKAMLDEVQGKPLRKNKQRKNTQKRIPGQNTQTKQTE